MSLSRDIFSCYNYYSVPMDEWVTKRIFTLEVYLYKQTGNSTGGLKLKWELESSAYISSVRQPWLCSSGIFPAWALTDRSRAELSKGHESAISCTTELPLKHAGHLKPNDSSELSCSFQQMEFTLRFGFGKLPTGLWDCDSLLAVSVMKGSL